MSVQQIEAVAQAFADALNHGESPAVDVAAVAELLDEDLEVFDTVPYRFDNKKQFVEFLQGATSRLASSTFTFGSFPVGSLTTIPGLPTLMTRLPG